jgi:hypothetical protein
MGVPVSAMLCIACFSVVTAVPVTGSLRITSTFINPIGIGISLLLLLLTAAASLSTGMECHGHDIALNHHCYHV